MVKQKGVTPVGWDCYGESTKVLVPTAVTEAGTRTMDQRLMGVLWGVYMRTSPCICD
jgi:hypothetical protein